MRQFDEADQELIDADPEIPEQEQIPINVNKPSEEGVERSVKQLEAVGTDEISDEAVKAQRQLSSTAESTSDPFTVVFPEDIEEELARNGGKSVFDIAVTEEDDMEAAPEVVLSEEDDVEEPVPEEVLADESELEIRDERSMIGDEEPATPPAPTSVVEETTVVTPVGDVEAEVSVLQAENDATAAADNVQANNETHAGANR